MSRIVGIIGRPNVGKSTLFNRLTQSKDAIVHETSGVTRDRHYGKSDWNGIDFSVIDTGGYVTGSDDIFEEEIKKQVMLAIDEADVIIFVVDVTTGICDLDETVARMLRKINKKVFLVVNKVDNSERSFEANEFYRLGFKELFEISSINGHGTGDLLDEVVKSFNPEGDPSQFQDDIPKFVFVGRPNVGKSTMINTLLGEDRNIVTPVAGTTRDTVHARYNKFGYDFYLLDTAGLRKKGKVFENIEFYSVMRSIRAIENSDVCILMIDATTGVEAQDVNIFNIIKKNRKGVVVVVNKWDLVEKDTDTTKKYTEIIKHKLAPFTDVPILFVSAINKQRISKLLDSAKEVFDNRKKRIKTSELNAFIHDVITENPPPSVKGKFIRIKYVTQLPTYFPSFSFFCNLPQYVKDPYKRFLENRIREKYNFTGVPIQIYIREK